MHNLYTDILLDLPEIRVASTLILARYALKPSYYHTWVRECFPEPFELQIVLMSTAMWSKRFKPYERTSKARFLHEQIPC
ncbi:hypothetical protein J41TS4_43560 [Paenibacillus apis]|uniref:Uncharacterized protein n=1 Tax=Paenibacillus apis TaxID=1792174 RepID=A0A919Y8R7_9BACL|nr:hypothetical protein J41TS4_43560 [Paenibacillus apis]